MITTSQLDAAALALLGYDVARLDVADLARASALRCWDVAGLLRHMNEQYETFATGLIGAGDDVVDDPRGQFDVFRSPVDSRDEIRRQSAAIARHD